ncbi:hypothetical protein DYU11_20875 [Fibrisoma montanum]|uniref:Uncharacterized protein n=1 Tax=Fibrisoma montanum TaxID=2305895 RepID=A0A418M432_9BACT|nr:hypothetical protein [Fibrisoma montanum]RIV20501.1 hypothetical protein DYU11_20875 [Fibrisoma montanum]
MQTSINEMPDWIAATTWEMNMTEELGGRWQIKKYKHEIGYKPGEDKPPNTREVLMAIAENTMFLYADVNELWHAVGRDFVILETIVDIAAREFMPLEVAAVKWSRWWTDYK